VPEGRVDVRVEKSRFNVVFVQAGTFSAAAVVGGAAA